MTTRQDHARWETTSAEETFTLGEALGRSMVGGITICLVGPLGAGKTQFVKGIASGNSTDDATQVTSPTFTLVNEYAGRLGLYHLDAYRLSGPDELLALGFDELMCDDSAVVVEWADRVRKALPDEALWVELGVSGETRRTLAFRATGGIPVRSLAALRTVDR